MSSCADLSAGTELAGYRIERVLGRGGMSVVYLAEDLRLKRKVALKLLSPELARDERFRQRFLVESELAASLEHPNVVPIYEAGESEGRLFIAMRYVDGADLRAKLRGGPLSAIDAVGLIAQIAEALDAAHERGLVHRDVKASNVIIAAGAGPAGSDHVYLADFGLSRRLADPGSGEDGHLMGTIGYAAPEQIEGGEVDGRADVYSLGCLLYECLVGETPFAHTSKAAVLFAHLDAEPPRASVHRGDLGEAIDSVIATSLAKSAEERYQSGQELVEAVREALGIAEPRGSMWWGMPLVLALAGIAAVAVGVAAYLSLASGGAVAPATASAADSVERIGQVSDRLAATVALNGEPKGLAVGQGAIWVATYRRGSQTQGISRIDPASNAVTRTYDAEAGFATGIAVGEHYVWTIYNRRGPNPHAQLTPYNVESKISGFDSIQRLDPSRGFSTAASYRFGFESVAVGEGAVWALTSGGAVWRIDSKSGHVVRISLPSTFPYHSGLVAIGAGGVWVLHGAPDCKPPLEPGTAPDCSETLLTEVSPATNHPVRTVRLPFEPAGLAVGDGAVWMTRGSDDSLLRLDPVTGRVTGRFAVGRNPVGVAAGPRTVWVANSGDGTV